MGLGLGIVGVAHWEKQKCRLSTGAKIVVLKKTGAVRKHEVPKWGKQVVEVTCAAVARTNARVLRLNLKCRVEINFVLVLATSRKQTIMLNQCKGAQTEGIIHFAEHDSAFLV